MRSSNSKPRTNPKKCDEPNSLYHFQVIPDRRKKRKPPHKRKKGKKGKRKKKKKKKITNSAPRDIYYLLPSLDGNIHWLLTPRGTNLTKIQLRHLLSLEALRPRNFIIPDEHSDGDARKHICKLLARTSMSSSPKWHVRNFSIFVHFARELRI